MGGPVTFEDAAVFANTWGLILLVVCFTAAVVYALWPANRKTFEHAARLPLDEDTTDDE